MPFGEIQLSKVTSDAFALIPVVNTFFGSTPTLPDWFPIPAYAVSNPIYLDTDGNGKYDAPLPFPDFCSKPCDVTRIRSDAVPGEAGLPRSGGRLRRRHPADVQAPYPLDSSTEH